MSKKFDKNLLNEELKRFKLISEYTFYTGRKQENIEEADDSENEETPDLEPVDDSNTNNDDINADVDKVGDELGVDTNTDETPDLNADMESTPEEQPLPDTNMGGEDEVELDVTQLVQGTEEAKQIAGQNGQKIEQLLTKFDELEGKLSKMDAINAKIDNLDQEFEKRVPTPAEKLELRALDSYPYSLKLTDYWAEKDGQYNVMDNGEKKEKIYTLTKDDVNSGYNEHAIKNSFDINDNQFEEEDI